MKLLTKISLNILAVSLFVFLMGNVTLYFIYRSMIDRNINRDLLQRKEYLVNELNYYNEVDTAYYLATQGVVVRESESVLPEPVFSDTVMLDQVDSTFYPHRKIVFSTQVKNINYNVSITKSLLTADLLIIRIAFHMTVLFLVLAAGMFFLNRFLSRKAWTDFYKAMKKLARFNVRSDEDFSLDDSDVLEFSFLYRVLNNLTAQIKKDYHNLKEYTEDASHEIQTPLAIISTKLETILQSENLSEDQLKTIVAAYEAANRLSKLNASLILLTRIENRQFAETKELSLSETLDKTLLLYEDMIEAKKIKVERNLPDFKPVSMNPYLADILIGNLIKNAIRHNIVGGIIRLEKKDGNLIISNSGDTPDHLVDKMFDRFTKSKKTKDSIGLGLSIVKKICEIYEFEIEYKFSDGLHTMSLKFKS